MNNSYWYKHNVDLRNQLSGNNDALVNGKYKIYTISDKGDIFYVGITQNSLMTRMLDHITNSKNKNDVKSIKIMGMLKNGNTPEIDILELVDKDNIHAFDYEQYWIEQLKSWGFNLLNNVVSRGKKAKIKIQKEITNPFK